MEVRQNNGSTSNESMKSNKKKVILIGSLVALLLIFGYLLLTSKQNADSPTVWKSGHPLETPPVKF